MDMYETIKFSLFKYEQHEVYMMKKERKTTMAKTEMLTRLALLIALNCISAYIIIPIPFSQSPIALQTLVVNLVAFLLPPKQACLTMLVYIGIGLIGVPVFTGGTAGPGKMFGPTGGYIWGYVVAVGLIAWLKGNHYDFKRFAAVAVVLGIPSIYLLGVVQLKLVTGMPWEAAVVSGVLPFIPLDIVKCIAAAALARPIYKIFGQLA